LLNWYRTYLPDFPLASEPLRELLSRSYQPWSEKHTLCVWSLAQCLLDALPAINFDPASPLHVQACPGELGFSVAALQPDPIAKRHLLVGGYSRLWTPKERQAPPLLLELTALTEGLLDLRHITAHASQLLVPCSPTLQKLASKPDTHHPTAAGMLLDLLLFKPDLKAAPVNFTPDLTWSGEAAWKPLAR